MDLVKLITSKIEEVETSGKLEEIIEKNVLSCLNDVVSDSFRWNGEAKKSIEDALKGKLKIDTEHLNLHRYQKIVADIVDEQVNDSVIKGLSETIKSAVNEVVEPLEKKEWKLSEIIAKFVEEIDKSYDGDMEDQYGECTLDVTESDISKGNFHIYFDSESNKRAYECRNNLFIARGKLCAATLDSQALSPFVVSQMNGFEAFLFKLYCNNVTIEVDENDCDLDFCREDVD